jgi:hypothetical protein
LAAAGVAAVRRKLTGTARAASAIDGATETETSSVTSSAVNAADEDERVRPVRSAVGDDGVGARWWPPPLGPPRDDDDDDDDDDANALVLLLNGSAR